MTRMQSILNARGCAVRARLRACRIIYQTPYISSLIQRMMEDAERLLSSFNGSTARVGRAIRLIETRLFYNED